MLALLGVWLASTVVDPCAFARGLPDRFPAGIVAPFGEDDGALAAAATHAAQAANAQGTCTRELADLLTTVVTDHHRAAQRSRVPGDLAATLVWYDALLTLPAASFDAHQMTFFRAELLWDMERFSDAALGYSAVVATNPHGPYARMAAFNRVLALEKLIPADLPTPTRSLTLTDDERALIDACDEYLARFAVGPSTPPQQSEVGTVALRAASILAAHRDPAGVARLWKIIRASPGPGFPAAAARVLIAALVDIDPAAIPAAIREIEAIPEIAHTGGVAEAIHTAQRTWVRAAPIDPCAFAGTLVTSAADADLFADDSDRLFESATWAVDTGLATRTCTDELGRALWALASSPLGTPSPRSVVVTDANRRAARASTWLTLAERVRPTSVSVDAVIDRRLAIAEYEENETGIAWSLGRMLELHPDAPDADALRARIFAARERALGWTIFDEPADKTQAIVTADGVRPVYPYMRPFLDAADDVVAHAAARTPGRLSPDVAVVAWKAALLLATRGDPSAEGRLLRILDEGGSAWVRANAARDLLDFLIATHREALPAAIVRIAGAAALAQQPRVRAALTRARASS